MKVPDVQIDSLLLQLAIEDTLVIDSAAVRDSIMMAARMDSVTLALRDSLHRVMYALDGADSLGIYIEDYSLGHTGLKRFFEALNNRNKLGRPVRIAFMGDSFIEGDIVVGDFRQAMQNEFGGHGVGFVPIHTPASQFRPTINQKVKGWNSYSLMKHKTKPFTLPGMLYEASGEEASLSCHTVNYYPNLKQANSLKIIYEQNQKTCLHLTYNDCIDTTIIQLPASDKITQYIVKDDIQAAHMKFTQATGFRMLGVALEDESGVIVDNFSLRGNSGMLLERFDPDYCASFNEIRPYDLIILQYGLNMVSEEQLNYSAYRNRMVEVIHHIRKCFPDSDLLLLGVSDRGRVVDSKFETMPAVLGMLHAQRQTAKLAGIPFWNTFGAMGGQNSMVKFVEKGWASKDYTHLSFRGGREVAHALYKALIMEKQFYDEAEKSIH